MNSLARLISPLPPPRPTTALFLGAGASVPFGFPLSKNLLKNIYIRLKRRSFEHLTSEDSTFLLQVLETLSPALASHGTGQAHLALPAVLGILNYMIVSGSRLRFGSKSRSVADARALLEYTIADELTPYAGDGKNLRLLKKFAHQLLENRDFQLGVISTNYDTCLEQVLFDHYFDETRKIVKGNEGNVARANHRLVGRTFDFGTSWRLVNDSGRVITRPSDPKILWYKLHGSLNWLKCDQCEHIYINPDWTIAILSVGEKSSDNTCDCGFYPLSYLMVTPSLVRDVRETNLLQIWRHSLELLRSAKKWIFVGYSLPTEDIAIRSILQRALSGSGRSKPQVLVVDFSPDGQDNAELRDRYLDIFPKARFSWGGIADLISHPTWLEPA